MFQAAQTTTNLMNDFEVASPPDDSVSALEFSPSTLQVQKNFLIAGSWDNSVRCWEVEDNGTTVPKSMKTMGGPVLDVCWTDEGTKVFVASTDNQVRLWDLASDQLTQVAVHDAPVKTCHWVKAPNYVCLMTGSWDKTIKFWDTRTPNPMMAINLPERCYCADVDYPMAVVGTAGPAVIIYSLENCPTEFKREIPLKYQHRALSIFRDNNKTPSGYAVGSIEGRVAVQYVNQVAPKDNFQFKCHRVTGESGYQDIFAVNEIAFHPVHGTLSTVGSDGTFNFWDKEARIRLKTSDVMDQPITNCAFNANGQIFAYAVGYDWSKGHEYFNPAKKPKIFLRSCFEEMKPKV